MFCVVEAIWERVTQPLVAKNEAQAIQVRARAAHGPSRMSTRN